MHKETRCSHEEWYEKEYCMVFIPMRSVTLCTSKKKKKEECGIFKNMKACLKLKS